MTGYYLYGLISSAPHQPIASIPVGAPRGGEAEAIETLACGALSVLASPISVSEVRRTRRNLLAHTRVLEQTMQERCVLPMRFGVIAEGREPVIDAVTPRLEELTGLLDRMTGCHEVGVRVRWSREACLADLTLANPDLAERHRAAAGAGAAGYQAKIDLGRRVGELIEAWRKDKERALLAELAPCATHYTLKAPEEDIEILRADFLVTSQEDRLLIEALDRWQAKFDGVCTVSCIGPAPIYNFVSLSLDLATAPRAETAKVA